VRKFDGAPDTFDYEAVAVFLDELPAHLTDLQREVFIMRHVEHLTPAEIASALGASTNAVHAHLRAARRIFKAPTAADEPPNAAGETRRGPPRRSSGP
jgi:DNA-directed RNA polymerase specialized sigma24 family protein